MGQHWLKDADALEAICQAADVVAGDVVLEVGPGTGNLTEVLLDKGARVIAVELDDSLVQRLPQRFVGQLFELHHTSILEFDLNKLPADYKLVANIPYYLTSNLLRVLSESSNPPSVVALLVQKEVAQRVVAGPGQMSTLSVTTQFYWQVSLGREVGRKLFTPPPKVDSQILILTRRPSVLFKDIAPDQFFRLVKAGFANRRKILLNSIAATLNRDKTEVEEQILAAGLNPRSRAQDLSMNDWKKLLIHFSQAKIS